MVMSEAASGPELDREWRYGKYRPKNYQDAYREGVVENVAHNRVVVQGAEWMTDRGWRTLILCRLKDHWMYLKGMLEKTGMDFHAIWGDTEQEVRNEAKRQLSAGQTKAVLATTIWDEGTDVPAIDAIVLAEGVKTPVNTLQRIGRGMRRKKTGENVVRVMDIAPTCHPKLLEHAAIRAETYERAGYEVITQEHWSGDTNDPDLLPFDRWDELYVV
jgi:superfamily II DNA or RNA helicase